MQSEFIIVTRAKSVTLATRVSALYGADLSATSSRRAFENGVYSRRTSRPPRSAVRFIANNKRRCAALFFSLFLFSVPTNIATTYRGHIDGHAAA